MAGRPILWREHDAIPATIEWNIKVLVKTAFTDFRAWFKMRRLNVSRAWLYATPKRVYVIVLYRWDYRVLVLRTALDRDLYVVSFLKEVAHWLPLFQHKIAQDGPVLSAWLLERSKHIEVVQATIGWKNPLGKNIVIGFKCLHISLSVAKGTIGVWTLSF